MTQKGRAIVTGGAGFIGSHLTERLLREGWAVLVVDNLSSGYYHNIPQGAEFLWLDLTNEGSIDMLPKGGVDAVFHLASHVGQELSFQRPIFDFKANAFSTLQLMKWCVQYQVKQFIFASSVNVYGNAEEMPIKESAPIVPPSPYAVGKIASEYFCKIYQDFGVNTTILRLFNVYGPRQDMRNMLQGMASIYMAYVARNEPVYIRGSKDRFRDFSYVGDVADAFFKCLNKNAYGKTYNIASGHKTYVWQLVEMIIKAFGHDTHTYPILYGEPTTGDQFGFYGDSSLITEQLGWKSTVSLEDGIREMAQWVKSTGLFQP
jgi:UDP-glucose 4-epimerase